MSRYEVSNVKQLANISSSLASIATHQHIDATNPPSGYTACVGDGTTDNTASIQALINYCFNNDKVLFFPVGVYLVTNTIYLPNLVKIKGASPASRNYSPGTEIPACRIKYTNASASLFVMTGYDSNGNVVTQGASRSCFMYMEDMGIVYNDIAYTSSSSLPTSTVFNNIAFSWASVINRCTFRSFDYVMKNCDIMNVTRITNNNFREFGTCAINAGLSDSYIVNNYFSGSTYTVNGSNAIDCTSAGYGQIGMTTFTNNWFEFCAYGIKGATSQDSIVSHNIFDYCYRALDGFGTNDIISSNKVTHSSKSVALPKFQSPSSAMQSDTTYVNFRIGANYNVTISNNLGIDSDMLVRLDNSSYRDIQTSGNICASDTSSNAIETPENIVNISIPKTGSMGTAHGTGITIQELNGQTYSSLPTTCLYNGRTCYVGNNFLTCGSDFKWRDANGNIFGYSSATLVPLFNDAGWGKSGTTTVSGDNKTLTVTTTAAWQDQTYSVNVTGGSYYKFYSLSPAKASDGTTNQVIELWWYDSSNNIISKDYPSNTSNYLDYTQAPSNAVKVTIHLRCQTSGLTYTWTGIYFIAFNATIEGKVVTSPSGYQYLITSDDSGNLISTRFIQ